MAKRNVLKANNVIFKLNRESTSSPDLHVAAAQSNHCMPFETQRCHFFGAFVSVHDAVAVLSYGVQLYQLLQYKQQKLFGSQACSNPPHICIRNGPSETTRTPRTKARQA